MSLDLKAEKPERELTKTEQAIFYASQWKLMWWGFRKHKLAVISSIIIFIMYVMATFAGFFSPYDPNERNVDYILAPPQKIHFIDEKGFSFRPFTYKYKGSFDFETMQRIYKVDKTTKLPVYFFVKGDRYKILGLFKSDIHLFGVKEEGTIYLFGTDNMGRDILSRIIYGGQVSMSIGLVGVFLSVILGLILGGISGYYGGTIDNIIQRIIELIRSFPTIPLWMALSAALPADWSPLKVYFGITVILSLSGWTTLGRQIRGKLLSLKSEDFVIAARLAGTSEAKIIARHLIPSCMSHIIASTSLAVPNMILAETSLSYLGLGLKPPVISWGVMLRQAQNVQTIALSPWVMIPGIFVIIYVLTFNFLGDGLRDAADPYS